MNALLCDIGASSSSSSGMVAEVALELLAAYQKQQSSFNKSSGSSSNAVIASAVAKTNIVNFCADVLEVAFRAANSISNKTHKTNSADLELGDFCGMSP